MLLNNEEIVLRALEPEDLDVLYKWENDASMWDTTNTVSPYSRFDLKRYIASSSKNIYEQNLLKLVICRKCDGAKLGLLDIFDFDPHNSRAEIGIIVDSAYRRCGYGAKALHLAVDYTRNYLKLNQVYAHIPVTNIDSISLFEKMGFKKRATLPSWIKGQDGWIDVAFMQLI